MEGLLQRQQIIAEAIQKISTNIKKDSASRKTTEYVAKRLESLEQLWSEFEGNNTILSEDLDSHHDYFSSSAYQLVKELYEATCELLQKTTTPPTVPKPGTSYSQEAFEQGKGGSSVEERGVLSRSDELISQQRTNFRALTRIVRGIKTEQICERWEIEDCLKTLHKRWKTIDELHWQIDNLLVGADVDYEEEYSANEAIYNATKRSLNQKLSYTSHQYEAVSQLEIPTFSGNYAQWPTFKDLYSEAIHKNPQLSKTQKMQHLKGKLRGEAERIVQHLNISADNYDACWEILTHRYNNQQLLFTKQMQIFMNQPTMTRHSAYEIKRLHDTSLESVHAIANLGVNMTTWDPILVHIITEKMDPETYTSYMENRKNPRELPSFDELISLLENKFTALEPINKKRTSNPPKQDQGYPKEQQQKSMQNKSFSRRTYIATAERKCPLCKSNHILVYCKTFQGLSSEQKIIKLQQLNVCKNCLYCHENKPCNSTKKCRVCEKSHHTTLHDMFTGNKPAYKETSPTTSTYPRTSNHVTGNMDEILLATVELQVMSNDGTYQKLRALLDQGSQINLITESAAQRLGLQRRKLNAKISGIGISANKSNGVVQLTCKSMVGDFTLNTEAMVMSKMLNNLPNHTFEKPQWPHLQNIILADKHYNISRQVDMLLDAAVYAEIIMEGIIRGPPTAPIAQQTKFGWVLMGNIKTFNCHAILNDLEEISQFWELEEIADNEQDMISSQEYCETLYNTTTKRDSDGRYEIRLPMKPNFEDLLGSSRPQAMAQFSHLEKRLAKDEKLCSSYMQFMNEYLQLGHMKECTSPREPSCFLPHHGVKKPDSQTTKLRVVLNASQKTSSGHSLNDLMERGPNLQINIQALILQWRVHKYVYTADIEKFYRQIRVHEQDQHLQKLIWRDSTNNKVKDYQLTTVIYGTRAAPYLAMRTIKQLVIDDGDRYPKAAEILNNQLYVDDLLGGNDDLEDAKYTQNQLMELLQGGGFNLRKWASNDTRLLEHLAPKQISQNMLDFKHAETNKTLGISWNPCTDNFTFQHQVQGHTDNNVITKRSILSDLSKLYDPLGWLSPVTVKAKIIFQQLWTTEITWDDPLPEHIQSEWLTFRNELHNLQDITIPRWIGNTSKPVALHGFCDASERAISCVIYCRSINDNGEYVVRLVAAKTKLAPLKKPITLPRLELCGAQLLAKLMKKIIESLKSDAVVIHGWTDSTVVLGWLKGNISRWKKFVANRVEEILNVMPAGCWKHVRSEENPADSASRGLNPSQLLGHEIWWQGPEWLTKGKLPIQPTEITQYQVPTQEMKRQKQVNIVQAPSLFIEEHLQKHSSMTRAVRVLGWISRFIHNCLNKSNAIKSTYLTITELEKAQLAMVKNVQLSYFEEEINRLQERENLPTKSKIITLNPYLDDKHILRVGGRLEKSNLTTEAKHPIILPHNSRLTELIINQAHKNTLHGGVKLTLMHIRNKYWILKGVKTVKGHILKCVTCHRFKSTSNNQLMADLPRARVTPSRPFTHTGVDFTGQVEVKANKGRGVKTMKAYVCIFVCLATKAVHIELVSDLSTDAFLAALKRFCARRARPQVIYSDNGRNFVGAAKILKKENNEALQYYINDEVISEMADNGIEWKFIAPSWPTAGGLWESAVKSMKHHLKRVIGEQKLTYEEFATLLAQIEACMNSRPLTALTNEIDDLDCLTAGHFLVGGPVLSGPLSPLQETRNIRTRWQLTERMHKDFWKRWSSDYLHTLQTRAKWWYPKRNLEIGDLVLIKEDNMPPANWLMGRVTDTHEGTDGLVRVVTLKTKNNIVKRPITKLSRLPIDQEEDTPQQNHDTANKQKEIQSGNIRNKTRGTSYLLTLICLLLCITPSMQQLFKTSTVDPNKLIYFDKLADMKVVQDNWKMVVYYNMTTYWRNSRAVEQYVDYLTTLTKNEPTFSSLTSQFTHEMSELQHYNDMLRVEHGRRSRRGLIDGVGYVQNYLFGVLDQRFAEQYIKDINSLQNNQNHLQKLYKEQTSIIEGEYNLLKRNENVMNNQFLQIDRQLKEVSERITSDRETTLDMMSSALTASLIISNLRRVQQSLLDLVTDVRNGRVDAHLLKPDQLQDQLNIISGQISTELSLPCVNSHHCVREMYILSRVQLRLTRDYMIFEVNLPLVNNEPYELSRMIPIPQIKGHSMEQVITGSEFMAVNLKKDLIMPLNYEDIATCTTLREHQLLCTLDKPLHDTKVAETICEAQIINNRNLSACRLRVSNCNDHWIQLQHRGAWLYTCCRECTVRIFCTPSVTSTTLKGTGIIELAPSCELKGDEVIIHAHHRFKSEITLADEEPYTYRTESNINTVINVQNYTFIPDEHHKLLEKLHFKIEKAKKDQDSIVELQQSHDTHRYVTYSVIILLTVALTTWVIMKTRKMCYRQTAQLIIEPTTREEGHSTHAPQAPPIEVIEMTTRHPRSIDRATSPTRFPTPGPRLFRGPRSYGPYPGHLENVPQQEHHDRNKYRINNVARSQDRGHHNQRQIPPYQVRQNDIDHRGSYGESNFYKNSNQCHVNTLGDIDHRRQHPASPWGIPAPAFDNNRQYYDDHRSPEKTPRHLNIGDDLPTYSGHRPPASDHYTTTTGPNNNNSQYTHSVHDTVDIIRKKLQNRDKSSDSTMEHQSNVDEDLRKNTDDNYPEVFQEVPQEQPIKKRIPRQKQNIKLNCNNMKKKIVHQLFKMDKVKIHKLMDNPSSSSKFEYAISSLITEGQNSLLRHQRSVAEKSLCSSSTDFIQDDTNTIYEDTFMKQMQGVLDPQDTVLLEDIKPLVMAELSRVLQLDEYQFELMQDHEIQDSGMHDYGRPEQETQDQIIQDYGITDQEPQDQGIQDYGVQDEGLQDPETLPKSEPTNYPYLDEVHNTDQYSQDLFNNQNQTSAVIYGNIEIISNDLDVTKYECEPTYETNHLFERRPTSRLSHNENRFTENMQSRNSIEKSVEYGQNQSISDTSRDYPPPVPVFDPNVEQVSDEDDTFAEFDKQYHVAVDRNFIENENASRPPSPVQMFGSCYDKSPSFSRGNIEIPNNAAYSTDIKKEVDAQLQDIAKSPAKLFTFEIESKTKTDIAVKKESEHGLEKENLSASSFETHKAEHVTHEEPGKKKEAVKLETSAHTKSVLQSNTRKRSIDQKPSHRKEKRKRSSQSECQEVAKSIVNMFNKETSKVSKRAGSNEKAYSDKYVKRKEPHKKAKEKDSDDSKKQNHVSSHSNLSPKDSLSNETSKSDTKVKLKPIDMFGDHNKKGNVHQSHRNTATPLSGKSPVELAPKPVIPSVTSFARKLSRKHSSTQVILKVRNRECQTDKVKQYVKQTQTYPESTIISKIVATNPLERMKEIDMEIQLLLQEKFKLYNSLETKAAETVPIDSIPSLSMRVFKVNTEHTDEKSNDSEDAIVDDFTSIPTEELEQIALESIADENSLVKSNKKSRRRKVSELARKSSISPTTKRHKKKSLRSPSISLIEQIIKDDRPIEDIISLDDFEDIPVLPKKKHQKSVPKKKSSKKTKASKSSVESIQLSHDIKKCSVVLERIDLSYYLRHKYKETPIEIAHQSAPQLDLSLVHDNLTPKAEECSLNANFLQEQEEIKNQMQAPEPSMVQVVEDVVNDLQFDMLDVSEDIIIGDNYEVKADDKTSERDIITEEVILDNSQSSMEEGAVETPGAENECKMYDYSTNENLRRDAITVTGNADAVLAIECIDNDFIAACLDGNVYHFGGDGQLLNTLRGTNQAVTCLTIVKEKYGTTVYTGSLDSRIRYYDLETGMEKGPECNVLSPIQTMDRAWDTVFVGTRTGFVLQFECKNNMLIPVSTVKFSEQSILALRAMKEGARKVLLVAARSENVVTIKDAQTGLLLRTLQGPKMSVYTLLFEDGKVYCGTSSHNIHVFDYASGSHVGSHEGGKGAVCLRASGGLLFAGCYDGCVYVYREGEARALAQLRGPSLMLLSLAIRGTKIIAGYKDRGLYIWKLPLAIVQEMIL